MKKLLTISLILLLSSCVTKKNGDIDGDTWRVEIPHAGVPLRTIIGETDLEAILDSIDFSDSDDANLRIFEKAFLESTKLNRKELKGHARLIFNDLGSVLAERQSRNVPAEPPKGTHKECKEAYSQKVSWHQLNNRVPATFGKMTEYVLTPVPGTSFWVGAIDLCTWVGSVNYYFNISFLQKGEKSLSLKRPPFSDVIQTLTEDDTEGYEYKLHAKGDGSVVYKNVFRNSVFYAEGDIIYSELEEDCFDTFYVDAPTGIKAIDLSDQFGFCMGRCDGKVLNTAS